MSGHIQDRLSDYIDAALSEKERSEITAHLHECSACESRFRQLRNMRKMLHGAPGWTPADSFYTAVEKRIQSKPSVFNFMTDFRVRTLASACVLMIIGWVTYENIDLIRRRTTFDSMVQVERMNAREPMETRKQPQKKLDASARESSPVPIEGRLELPPKDQEALKEDAKQEETPAEFNDETAKKSKSRSDAPLQFGYGSGLAGASAPSDALQPQSAQLPTAARSLSSLSRAEDKGGDSEFQRPHTHVITSPFQWNEVWKTQSPNEPVPAIDFSQFCVVSVTYGRTPITGIGYEIMGTEDKPDEVIVYYRVVKDMPFHYLVLPRKNLPIKFQQI